MKRLQFALLSILLAVAGTALGTSALTGTDGKIVAAQNGDRSLLAVGEYALFAISGGADGKLTTSRVQITKDGVKPPQ